jgi:C4-dicarboxylate transporter DctM subunit
MAGISGSANADAAAIGSVVIPAMRRAGYPAGFTIGIVASAATIGPIIPPSLIMIIYSSVTGMSIGSLFLAGFVPGLMVGLALMIMVAYFSHRRNYVRASKRAPLREVLRAILDSALALISPVLIIGGILSGAFTATEAGALASVYAFAAGMFYYKEIRLRDLPRLFVSASITTAIGMLIFAMCTVFGFLLARANFSAVAVDSIKMISANPTVVWFLIMALMVFVGMFVEAIAAMIIFIPVLTPLVNEMGYDPLHFALIFIILCLVGSLTPPVGMVLYISCAVGRTPVSEVEIWPFVFAILAVIVVCIFVPQLVLFIPRLFFGT